MFYRKLTLLIVAGMVVGSLLGIAVTPDTLVAQAPACNNSICNWIFWPPEDYDDWCGFFPQSSCWYNEQQEIRCKPCAEE